MWEAFLLQMNDFDKFLERELRHMLDHVVARVAPARGSRRQRARRPVLTVEVPAGDFAEVIPVEPGVLPVTIVRPQL